MLKPDVIYTSGTQINRRTCFIIPSLIRFVSADGGISKNLEDIQTKDIIPVELNSYMCRSARIMTDLYKRLGDNEKADTFQHWGDSIQEGIDNILWNDEKGAWFDYDLKRGKQRNEENNFYPSNIAPLWAECYP